jgi:hypothetical protein
MKYYDIEITDKLDFEIVDKPYVIKNYANSWYAYQNWSFDFLKNLKGSDLPVNAVRGNAALGEGKIISIKFTDYIDKLVSNYTAAYLTTFYLFKKFPDLKKHIEYNNIKKNAFFYHLLSWIGPKGSITGFHCDWSENLNVQIRGEKFFYLVSPDDDKYMYISKKFERISSTSNIDINNWDKKKFPLFEKAKVIRVHLKEGDAIYIPRGWWHYVESLTPSIGISFHYWRFKNMFRDLFLGTIKVFLHDIGLYKKYNCACHTIDSKGKRLKRG